MSAGTGWIFGLRDLLERAARVTVGGVPWRSNEAGVSEARAEARGAGADVEVIAVLPGEPAGGAGAGPGGFQEAAEFFQGQLPPVVSSVRAGVLGAQVGEGVPATSSHARARPWARPRARTRRTPLPARRLPRAESRTPLGRGADGEGATGPEVGQLVRNGHW